MFSEPVTGFTASSVTLRASTAPGTLSATVTAVGTAGTTYDVAVSGMTGSGTVTASIAAGAVTDPQTQLVITSRLDRVQWKYSAIAYALTLKHVGVLMQNLYLIATAMNLSACGNGSADTDVVARGVGGDGAQEPPVGELLIGGPPSRPQPNATGFRDIVDQTRGD